MAGISISDAGVLLGAGALAGVVGSAGGTASLISYPALLAVGIPALPLYLPRSGPGLQAVHPDLVGRHTLGTDLGRRRVHRRHLRRDGLAGRPAGRDRGRAGPPPPGSGREPVEDGPVDLSSSWLEGTHCPLAARGYSRDGKKGKLQIEYGLFTDPEGRPVAVWVFPGNTGDPAAFTQIITVVREKFKLRDMVMVGDRGMITSARIAALNQTGDGTPRPDPYGWIPRCAPRPSRS